MSACISVLWICADKVPSIYLCLMPKESQPGIKVIPILTDNMCASLKVLLLASFMF